MPQRMSTLVNLSGVRVFDGRAFLDGKRDVLVRGGTIEAIERMLVPEPGSERIQGGVLLPGFVDAHVHLSLSTAAAVAAGGVTTVLDLGAPLAYARGPHPPLGFRAAGPLVTARGGYPTRSWGAGGYGLEVASVREAREAVARLADLDAAVIKVALEPREGPSLPSETLHAVVAAAHARGLLVFAHAVDRSSVGVALEHGIDALAHTPVDRLGDEIANRLGRAATWVISTVRAFGAARATRANLEALAAAGCRIVYGTDLGNGDIRPGIDVEEIGILQQTLGNLDAALAAATSSAGELAGHGGRLEAGAPADMVWLPRLEGADDLAGEKIVWIGGIRVTRR